MLSDAILTPPLPTVAQRPAHASSALACPRGLASTDDPGARAAARPRHPPRQTAADEMRPPPPPETSSGCRASIVPSQEACVDRYRRRAPVARPTLSAEVQQGSTGVPHRSVSTTRTREQHRDDDPDDADDQQDRA